MDNICSKENDTPCILFHAYCYFFLHMPVHCIKLCIFKLSASTTNEAESTFDNLLTWLSFDDKK